MRSLGLSFLALTAIVLACLGPATISAQQSIMSRGIRETVPTGTYAAFQQVSDPFSPTNRIHVFTLRLETNGTYFAETADFWPVQDGDLVRLRPKIAQGRWEWNAQKRVFDLEPADFIFYLKRLRVDAFNPNRILWGSSFLERQEDK